MKKNKNIIKIIVLVLIFSLVSSFFLIEYYSKEITPTLIEYAELQTKELALKILTNSFNEEISKNYPDNILDITRTNNNDIELINYNTKIVSQFLSTITQNIENNLKLLENGHLEELGITEEIPNFKEEGIIYNIPLGIATKSTFFSNLGPQIPIKLKINKDIQTKIKTNITNYGINSALLELDLEIEASIQVILPFTSKITQVTYTAPLSIELINGKIPNYYLSGLEYKNN